MRIEVKSCIRIRNSGAGYELICMEVKILIRIRVNVKSRIRIRTNLFEKFDAFLAG
jgi:hypothetical protein